MKYYLIIGGALLFLISLFKIKNEFKDKRTISLGWILYALVSITICLTVIFVEPKQ